MQNNYECRYCGHKWKEEIVMFMITVNDEQCPRCGDENIKVKKVAKSDIFGYNNQEENKKLKAEDDGPDYTQND